jgi:hypothetical protein
MANKVKSKRGKDDELQMPEVQRAIAEDVQDLYAVHETHILKVLNESEDRKVTVNFAVEFDDSESEGVVETKMRFSQAVTDKRTRKLDPPGATTLFTQEELAATRKRSSPRRAESNNSDVEP